MKTQFRFITMLVLAFMALGNAPVVAADHDVMAKFDRVDVGAGHPVTGYTMHYQYKFKGTAVQGLHILINVPVPSDLPGFDTLMSAVDSELMVTLTRGHHLYAECTIPASRSYGLLGSVSFEMDIMRMNGALIYLGGMCDTTPWADKPTSGVPEMVKEDMAKAYVYFGPDKMWMITLGRAHPM
ncbi:MAG: hypothetical protein HKN70_02790 [Gammaproteobacteria bacterium]|nr:hypothetical protein [Gammaproteobacteria bacterium]